MVAKPPSGVINRHRGFQNIGLPNPVFTVENSADNNPIHTTHSKPVHTTWMVPNPSLQTAEWTFGSVLSSDWLRTSSTTEISSN